MSSQNNKIFPKLCNVRLQTKDVKYDLLSYSSSKRHFFRVNFLINAAFDHAALLGCGFYFTFPFPNAAFKRGNTVIVKMLCFIQCKSISFYCFC